MLGAIIGDIVGSIYEWNNYRAKDFEFMTSECFFTDDTVMTAALAKALLESKEDYSDLGELSVYYMQKLGTEYPGRGYGGRFAYWLSEEKPEPYNSFGNGAAMRISSAGIVAKDIKEAIFLSKTMTEVTHNHSEGIKGAEAVSVCIYMAKNGSDIQEIKNYVNQHYYNINFTIDEIRDTYKFNETCQNTVPQALEAFFESEDFEDAIRIAISVGGDSDTLAAITGSIAEAYYGIPDNIRKQALSYLDDDLIEIINQFENKYERQSH